MEASVTEHMTQHMTVDDLLASWRESRILVLGDVMLDWFIWGNVTRISPEAPVPVVEVQRESRYPGGAANVARNITPFGTTVRLAGVYGCDPQGDLLAETLATEGIGEELCFREAGFQTITKTRVVARHQQVVRIDRERREGPGEALRERLLAGIIALLPEIDGLIIEDYGKGLITPTFMEKLLAALEGRHLIVTVDPKPGNPIEWRGVTTVKPNRSEAFACAGTTDLHHDTGLDPLADGPLLETATILLERWSCAHLLLTLGEQGMLVCSADGSRHAIPAQAREVFDVSGAGDTAIAIYTLALTAGLSPVTAATISNLASSIVVGKLGTAPIELDELTDALRLSFPAGIPVPSA